MQSVYKTAQYSTIAKQIDDSGEQLKLHRITPPQLLASLQKGNTHTTYACGG